MKKEPKQGISTDIINPSFKRSKFVISKSKPQDQPIQVKAFPVEKPQKLRKTLKIIPESVTHSDLIIPISTYSRNCNSKRSMSVVKLPSILQEEKFSHIEQLGRNRLGPEYSKNADSRLTRMRKSINDSMLSMNRKGILNASANQLRVDTLIESESFALYFLFRGRSISHANRASKAKLLRQVSIAGSQEKMNRSQVLEKVKSVVLSSHYSSKPSNHYENLNDYLKFALKSIENCRSSIQFASSDDLKIVI